MATRMSGIKVHMAVTKGSPFTLAVLEDFVAAMRKAGASGHEEIHAEITWAGNVRAVGGVVPALIVPDTLEGLAP
jgi:hypothetical protein